MRILLDECLPVRLRTYLPDHEVYTVGYLNWKSIGNGRLLAMAKSENFDCLITSDQAVEQQQNLWQLPISVIILHPHSNAIDDLLPLVPVLITRLTELSEIPTILHVKP